MTGCIQCGVCCKKYGMRLEASPLDIAKWRQDGRTDILRHVGICTENGEISHGNLWVGDDGERLKECPFLTCENEKFFCGIQDVKPEVCTFHYCEKYY
ncbi:MAG TPA: YkgJ family cysteine cluster protein [Methanocellaceae archaeon]